MDSPTFLWLATVFLLLYILPLTKTLNNLNGTTEQRQEVIVKPEGVVAADDGRCSQIGVDILRQGGNAIDASVAAAFCLGVVSPASSGIGGGGFVLVRLANGTTQAFDMRETAPMDASEDMFSGNTTLKERGALSVAVPGEVAGLYQVWKQYGKLPWKILVTPAANLARQGFNISTNLHKQMKATEQLILADEGLRRIFTSNGKLKQPGDLCRNLNLAWTLRKIAELGPNTFYSGSVGFLLVTDIQRAGGIMRMKDLDSYRVRIREPLSADIEGYKILTMPPPSSGGASMILVMNILARYGLPSGVSGPLGVHRLVEALKHAFAVRMNLGDPDFVDVSEVVSDMLSPKFAEELKKTIYDNMTFDSTYYGGKYAGNRWKQIHDHGTTHVCIVDSERNAVSMTSTINSVFGAKMMSWSTGIILNNEMDDFSIPLKNRSDDVPAPAPTNFIHPWKRPLSSMTPTIVLKDEKLKAVVGASGGANITAGTTQVILNHFFLKMDPLYSVMAPRVYHQLIPNKLRYENWTTEFGDHFEVPDDVRSDLEKRKHVLEGVRGGTICQFVVQNIEGSTGNGSRGELVAVSDPRKGGFPAGY